MTDTDAGPQLLRHNAVDLALHRLRDGDGRPLLHLHGLGEATPASPPSPFSVWPGPIYGLDFTGHGASTVPHSGGYTAEVLMADADVALAELGPATLYGRGVGGYVAVLIAGARPDLVRGAIVDDGPGLAGGPVGPGSPSVVVPPEHWPLDAPPDPFALVELTRDIRPPDYSTAYVRQAVQFSGLDAPIAVAAVIRPPWLEAVVAEPGVICASLGTALARYAAG